MSLPPSPLTMRGRSLWTFLFAFRTPISAAKPFLPEPLELLTFGEHAFWSVAICESAALRPGYVLPPVGLHAHGIVYRLLVSHQGEEGYYVVRTETDQAVLQKQGLRPAVLDVFDDEVGTVEISVQSSEASLQLALDTRRKPSLLDGSPFASLTDAGQFLRERNRYFTVEKATGKVSSYVLERPLDSKNRLIHINSQYFAFFQGLSVFPEIVYEVAAGTFQWKPISI